MFRDFLPEHVANKLDIIAKSSKVTHDGTGGLSDDSKPWTNPLYAIQDTPPYIQHLPMRSHQLEGLAWLSYMHRQGSPAILGDEMGLGKTLQTIALLGYIKFELKKAGTSLVICPLGVLNTWMEEFKKWCPDLKVVRLHSSVKSERENLKSTIIKHADEYDAVITTYDVVVGELRGVLSKRVWRYVVLDEGHKIKNEDTNISQVIRTIKSQGKLILTGTPLQNNLHELWAMLNYLLPDIFAVSTPFDEAYDISSGEIQEATLNAVHFVLKPFILRRLKSEVEKTLPPRGVVEISIPLTEAQQFWYKQLLQRDSDIFLKLDNAVNKSSDNSMEISSDGVILSPAGSDWKRLQSLMMQLRKCCNHPYLFPGADPHPGELDEGLVTASGKIALLDRLLPKLKARGHRVCLFSQFTATLDIIEDYCMLRRYKFKRIDGSVNRVRRAISIAEFQKEGSKIFIFLMSTRAGGLGITLTAADTVILFDSDWNPMVDLQAMARVHRIGQTKRVAVYRLVTAGTVEQRMVQRAQKKMFLDRVVNRGSSQQAEDEKGMSFQQLLDMFRFGMQAVLRTDLAKKEITEDELENILDRSKYTTEEAKVQHMGAEIEDESTENFVKFNPTEAFTSLTSFEGVDYREKTKPSSSDVASRVHRAIGVNRIESEPRARKSRFKEIDGENILLLNDYELGTYLSVYDVEQKDYSRPASRIRGRKHEHIPGDRLKKQRAGVDYEHDVLCLNCWDGGKLICCDFCPAVYHVDCAGTTEKIVSKGFICPQHSCDVCLRNTGAAGGLLFRCIACPQAFCEDHVPVSMIYVGECKRYKALGQRHPKQAYFMYCSPQCRDFERAITEINEEEDSDDAIAPIKTEPKSELSDQERMDVPLHGKKTHLPKHTIKQKSKGKNKKVKLDRTLY